MVLVRPLVPFLAVLTSAVVLCVGGHGAMITPPSRNAVDRHLVGFNITQAYDCNCGCKSYIAYSNTRNTVSCQGFRCWGCRPPPWVTLDLS